METSRKSWMIAVAAALLSSSAIGQAREASEEEVVAAAALSSLVSFPANSRMIARQYTAEEIVAPAIELASTHEAFRPGSAARRALIRTLLLARDSAGNRAFSVRSPWGDFLLGELRDGSDDIKLEILNARPGVEGPYSPDVCAVLSVVVTNPVEARNLLVLRQSLLEIGRAQCSSSVAMDAGLRSLVVEGIGLLDPEILLGKQPTFSPEIEIPMLAAMALLAISPEPKQALDFLFSLKSTPRALAVRRALGAGLAPDGRFDRLDPHIQQEWLDALLTLIQEDDRPGSLGQDEASLLIMLGNRQPRFRQDIGNLLRKAVTDPATDTQSRDAMRGTLEAWSKP